MHSTHTHTQAAKSCMNREAIASQRLHDGIPTLELVPDRFLEQSHKPVPLPVHTRTDIIQTLHVMENRGTRPLKQQIDHSTSQCEYFLFSSSRVPAPGHLQLLPSLKTDKLLPLSCRGSAFRNIFQKVPSLTSFCDARAALKRNTSVYSVRTKKVRIKGAANFKLVKTLQVPFRSSSLLLQSCLLF
jgi:hypothetical protein